MNQQVAEPQPYDLHAAIARLAEVEYECLLEHDYGTCAAGCKDGYIVPFKALRALCPCLLLIERFAGGTSHWFNQGGCTGCYHRRNHTSCDGCEGRGWIPEPDLERACWRVWKMLSEEAQHALVSWHQMRPTWEEAVLREAAGAWLEKQR